MFQLKFPRRLNHAKGFFGINQAEWLAEGFGAEAAGAGADVAENLKGERAASIAMRAVGAFGLFTDGVQPKFPDGCLDRPEIPAVRNFLLQKLRQSRTEFPI